MMMMLIIIAALTTFPVNAEIKAAKNKMATKGLIECEIASMIIR